MKNVIFSLFVFFAMASTAYADPKNPAPAFGETSVSIVDDHERGKIKGQDGQGKKEQNVKKEKAEKKDKKAKKDKSESKTKKERKTKKDRDDEADDDHGYSRTALGEGAEEHLSVKKEKKSKKEHKHD